MMGDGSQPADSFAVANHVAVTDDQRQKVQSARTNGKRVKSLDGLRGIAICLVLLSHLDVGNFNAAGPSGVTLFFVLSGYLITLILTGSSRLSLREFYGRRIRRLYPALMLAVLAATLLGVIDGIGDEVLRAIRALTYVSNYYAWQPGDLMGNLSHTWSLAVEEQFYLLWPLVLMLKRNVRFIAFGVLAALGWRVFMTFAEPNWLRVAFGSDTNAFALLAGAALALAPLPRPSRLIGRTGLAATVGLALLPAEGVPFVLITFLIVPLSVVCVYAASEIQLLENRFLVYLGTISYGLYLWHLPIFYVGSPRVLMLPLVVGMAALSWRLVEEPLLRRHPPTRGKTGDIVQSSR